MPLAPGTRLGLYEILAPIGAGGMGEVYKARDGRLDYSDPAISPDGTRIVFRSERGGPFGQGEVYTVPALGGDEVLLHPRHQARCGGTEAGGRGLSRSAFPHRALVPEADQQHYWHEPPLLVAGPADRLVRRAHGGYLVGGEALVEEAWDTT